jgi:hypothetical protein
MTPNPRRCLACSEGRSWIEAAVFVMVICRLDFAHGLLALALVGRLGSRRSGRSAWYYGERS